MTRTRLTAVLMLVSLMSCKSEIAIPVDPPEARADYRRTAVDTPLALDPRDNDHDPTGEALTVIAIGTPSHGTALLSGGGSVTYTPASGYQGGDSFSYTLADASGNQVTGKVSITVGTDSTRIVYGSNQDDYFTIQLYLADTAHPDESFVINHRLQTTSGQALSKVTVYAFAAAEDGSTAVYTADDSPSLVVVNVFAVHPNDPGTAINVTQYPPEKRVSPNAGVKLSADGDRVLFLAFEVDDKFELFTAQVSNPGVTTRIGPQLDDTQAILSYEFSPDGTKVIYLQLDSDAGGVGISSHDLFVVDLANPSVATKLNGTANPQSGAGPQGYALSPTGTLVAFTSIDGSSTIPELYLVDYASPAAPVKMSGTVVGSGDGVFDQRFSPDGSRLFYLSEEHDEDQFELYTVPVASPGASVRLTPPRTVPSGIADWDVGGDGTYVTFVRDDLIDLQYDLFRVDVANPEVAVQLNPTLPTSGDVAVVRLSTIEPRKVLFLANYDESDLSAYGLFEVDVDAPMVAVELGTKQRLGSSVRIDYSLDGTKVLRSADPLNRGSRSIHWVERSAPATLNRLTPERLGGHLAQLPWTRIE
jgi:hypothetical protein